MHALSRNLDRTQRLLALLLLFGASACSGDELSLFVDLRTDLTPGVEFTFVDVSLDGSPPMSTPVAEGQDFVAGRRIAEWDGISSGNRRLIAELGDATSTTVATRRVAVSMTDDTAVTVVITRGCVDVMCPGPGDPDTATQCWGTACVPEECTPETPDTCSSECDVDTDCPAGAACAQPVCSSGVCLLASRDGSCGVDEYCDVDLGCIVPPTGCVRRSLPPSEYLFCPEAVTWDEARTACEAAGYSLVTIVDSSQNAWIREEASNITMGAEVWLGLNDLATEGTFLWEAEESPVSYDNWEVSQPNGDGDCGAMSLSAGDWYDRGCAETKPYVCERFRGV
jgi:hypothetical protein